jgi:hypothetical protein
MLSSIIAAQRQVVGRTHFAKAHNDGSDGDYKFVQRCRDEFFVHALNEVDIVCINNKYVEV